ncbi:uncharacterized protein [Henckelia pumila]|uniref:uncharacterized protein n=1 Tax=Henckelia pumila TaxID=405737 RepID=UPI003C6DC0DE
MPQVDIETLVSACAGGGGNDRKISCETLAEDTSADGEAADCAADVTPDLPSGSFWLSKDAEYDWFDRTRKESTKGYANNSSPNRNLNPSSQKLSAKLMSKASILRLPKAQVDTKRRTCKPVNIRLFPNRFASSVSVTEPGSPKVSCMGRVRSKRCRRRSRRGEIKPVEKEKTGLYSRIMSMFRFRKGVRKPGSRKVMEAVEEEPAAAAVELEPPRKSMSVKVLDGERVAEPPGLGGMKRFSSGRRPDIGLPSFQSGGA